MEAMVAFYSQAFGIRFREVDAFGIRSQFGEIGGITLKLVPLRDGVDFEGYPLHQLGFDVPDVEAVLQLAEHHGGRGEGEILRDGSRVHTAVRDPDGNTIELYSTQ
jgi:catechol 2,3-dioxygenase-like lactoylglutathione lyase family enzyme